MEIVIQERYQDIIFARMETFYSSTCISTLIVFEFLISFLNVFLLMMMMMMMMMIIIIII